MRSLKKFGTTDTQTHRQTDRRVYRVASQLKMHLRMEFDPADGSTCVVCKTLQIRYVLDAQQN